MGLTDSPLRDLIDAARAGDREAREDLLGRYRNYLLLLARLSLSRGLQAKVGASDVVQDVLLKAHEGLESFRGGTEPEVVAWLQKILSRTLVDANRRFRENEGRCVDRERSLDAMVRQSSMTLGGLPAASGTSPSRGAQKREAGARVADLLARLKPDDREVIILRNLEDRGWGDVARCMDRSPEAVRALWGRAFQRLGALVGE